MEQNKIYNMNCLEGMKTLEDGSVDLIIADPPYNIGIAEWDKIENYSEWMEEVFKECERVLAPHGSFYWFHNSMPKIAEFMEFLKTNTTLEFNSFIIWDKGDSYRAIAWKVGGENNSLRSWFQTTEYALLYTKYQKEFSEKWEFQKAKGEYLYPTLRQYFENLQKKHIKKSVKEIGKILGNGSAEHAFRWNSSQWSPPTEDTYNKLIEYFNIDKYEEFVPYEDLRKSYEDIRKEYKSKMFRHNVDKKHNNVWNFPAPSASKKIHITQKPLPIIERMIRVSSHQSELVLDPFMGSGTTAEAAIITGRNFIGFEKNKEYFEKASARIKEAQRLKTPANL